MVTMMKVFLALILFTLTTPTMIFSQQAAPPDELVAAARQFVDQLVKENFAAAVQNFDETMTKAMPADKTRELWTAIKAQFGAFQRQGAARKDKYGELSIVYVACEFERGQFNLKVVFDAKRRIAGVGVVPADTEPYTEVPDYAKPDSYTEREVTVGAGEWALPGTLTLPKGDGPFAAVVLVHGSGPNDRDQAIGPNKPFRDIAWGLASQGIAVLRYDKRGKVYAANMAQFKDTLTVKEEAVDDALAAVALLRKTDKINPKKIFVAGLSLGGMLIPRIGVGNPEIAGLIVLAGLTRPLEDTLVEQYTHNFSLDGQISEAEQKQLDSVKAGAARVKALKPGDQFFWMGAGASYWLDLRGYDPPTEAKKLRQPMLILQGEKDYQVTMRDFENWKKALSPRKDVEFKSYPKLYHIFIETEDRPMPANYEKPGHVAKYVIDDLARWIRNH